MALRASNLTGRGGGGHEEDVFAQDMFPHMWETWRTAPGLEGLGGPKRAWENSQKNMCDAVP